MSFLQQIVASIFSLELCSFFLSQTKQTDNLKNLPVCREVTKRQQELIEEFDKEECSDKERIAAASG
jgi:hypothetical protein